MRATKFLIMAGVLGVACASAATIGTFSMSGDVTVTPTMMMFNSDAPGNAPNMFSLTLGSGLYAGENGQNGIQNLNIAAEPVGTTFTATPFINFDVNNTVQPLLLNFIFAGTGTSTLCNTSPSTAAPNQLCTPANPGGSPFTFLNQPPPTSPQSTAQFVLSGTNAAGDTWTGIFTSQFNEPFQTVLEAFAPGGSGSITNAFSATITVSSPVPEPGPLTMMGIGLGLLAFWGAGSAARKRQRGI